MKWPAYPLSKIAVDIQPGFARQPKNGTNGLPQLRTNNVSSEGRLDLSLVKKISASNIEIDRYSLIKGDVLFNNTNSADLVGKTAFFNIDEGPYLFSNHMTRIRVNHDIADPRFISRYLYWTWKSGGFQKMVTRWVNQAAINKTMLGGLSVKLPPLSEQRKIAKILDQADQLRKLHADADAKAQRIMPALFIKMFGDPAKNSVGWDTVSLDKVVEIGTRLVDPNHPDFLDLPHIGGEHIEKVTGRILSPPLVRDSKLRSNKFYFSSDHVLLSKIRPYLNKVAYPHFNGVCSADIYPLHPKNNKITHWYLISLLRTQAFLDYAKVHSDRLRIPKLNKTQLGAFEFPFLNPT